MIRVYNYMASGLALSGIVAFALFASPAFASVFFQVAPGQRVVGLNVLGWIAILAPLGLLMFTSFRAAQMSVGAVQAVYWAVTGLMGVSLSLLLFRYTGASVARTFFVTAASFGALSLYGYTTKRDLSAFGKFLFMGLVGIVIASLVNMFVGSQGMSFIISILGVLIFSGLIAYDTQKIKEQYDGAYGSAAAEKIAIFGALSLYLDFINLFQFLMAFMGQNRN
jgi:FtsH-binding integral membrane protein